MLEIGVSAGLTSGALLFAANRHHPASLDGVDIAETVYYDQTKRVGEVVEVLESAVRARYALHLKKTAIDVMSMDKSFDLAFIDGNHAHPWATFDLLCILPKLRKGAVVILHDIHYFCTHSQGGYCLFESVTVPKAKVGNIGCLITDDVEQLLEGMYSSFTMNWQDMLPAESIASAASSLETTALGSSGAKRFSSLLQTKHDEYARSFPIYKYMRQQQWGREMESRKVAAKYRELLTRR
jgi:hypothetical protein